MTPEKHTPGPWKVERGMDGDIWVVASGPVYRDGTKGPMVVATLPCDEDAAPEDRRGLEADAHLIAAAPDMLTALKRVSEEFEKLRLSERHPYSPARDNPLYDAFAKARAAIRNATGEP